MQFVNVVVVVLLSLHQQVFGFLNVLRSENTVIQNSDAKDYQISEFNDYMKQVLSDEHRFDESSVINFPRTLKSDGYTLSEGKVERYRDPRKPHGFYDKVLFHQDEDEFFGVLQIHTPMLEFSHKFEFGNGGAPQTGKISMLVSHKPVQLQMDFGQKKDNLCIVDQSKNSLHYFFGDGLIVKPTVVSDSPSGKDAGEKLIEELKNTWVPELLKSLVKIKTDTIMNHVKKEMLNNPKKVIGLDRVCQNTQ
uniref:Lipid-binding serum glycoprotein N-terminal domain-containing protein n=1 Tax=Graphocephala atropunctata TaxID=36148 RepID=A0A1B6KGM4_9HEMI